jgi:hypothetical protein
LPLALQAQPPASKAPTVATVTETAAVKPAPPPLKKTTVATPPPVREEKTTPAPAPARAPTTAAPTAATATLEEKVAPVSSAFEDEDEDRSYATHLWDRFDVVFQYMTDGRNDLKTMKGYLLQRADGEVTYARHLQLASKHGDFKLKEKSNIAQCWSQTRDAAITLSRQHEQLGTTCKQIASVLEKSIVDMKTVKTQAQNSHKKLLQDLNRRKNIHDRAQNTYTGALSSAEAVHHQHNSMAPSTTEKNRMKIEVKLRSALSNLDSAHIEYKSAVSTYKQCQENYDVQLAVLLTSMEEAEKRRITVLLEQLSRFSQSHDFIKNSLNQILLFVNKGLAAVHVDDEVYKCVVTHRTGHLHPEHVRYAPLESKALGHNCQKEVAAAAPSFEEASKASIATPPSAKPPAKIVAAPPASTAPTNTITVFFNAPVAAAPPLAVDGPIFDATALYEFSAAQPGDVSFKVGDIISVTQGEGDWWTGTVNGQSGTFPANYVEKIVSGPAATTAAAPTAPPARKTEEVVIPEGAEKMDVDCKALYAFEGINDEELTLAPGDVLHVLGKLSGWFYARNSAGQLGNIPANYVELL